MAGIAALAYFAASRRLVVFGIVFGIVIRSYRRGQTRRKEIAPNVVAVGATKSDIWEVEGPYGRSIASVHQGAWDQFGVSANSVVEEDIDAKETGQRVLRGTVLGSMSIGS
jgi:hypothetical protein